MTLSFPGSFPNHLSVTTGTIFQDDDLRVHSIEANGVNAPSYPVAWLLFKSDSLPVRAASQRAGLPIDALSYSWGNEQPTESIQIIAQNIPCIMPIIPNLEAALRQLRHPDRNVVLWVDAICINQADKVEKSHQVPKMAEIYSEAANVRVWLGKEENKSELALKFIHQILDFKNFDRLTADSRRVPEWAALLSLMKRPWFGRRWVVQEMALAKKAFLHCGKDSVPWDDFADALRLFEERQETIEDHFIKAPDFGYRSDLVADIKAMSATRLGMFIYQG
jgi:Heterokaryon incompatibility protein (HET)